MRISLKYLKTELGLETLYQLPIQVILLLLARTATKTNGGLEAVFSKSELLGPWSADTFLIIYIIWSLKSCVILHQRQTNSDKVYLPISSKIFVFLSGLFASSARVIAIVAVFIPSLGLLSILHHWEAEQIPFWIRKAKAEGSFGGLDFNDVLELRGLNETVYWRELDRTDWSEPSHPIMASYTLYTGLTLEKTFIAFLVVNYLHFLAIIAVKVLTSDNIRKATKFDIVRHCLQNMNFPNPYEDFDVGKGNIDDYRVRRRQVKKEMFSVMIVNFSINISMLTPLIYTGPFKKNICRFRNEYIYPSILSVIICVICRIQHHFKT